MSSSKKNQNKQQKQEKFIEQPIETVNGQIRIKKYIILQSVGSGSYSKCYLVKNMDSDSTYVAKVIPKKKLQILQRQKLIYQIKIHQSLSHPNVVHLDHWFEDQNSQYIFMEYCPNKNLENKLGQCNYNMNEKQIKKYGYQIVNAISYIHSQNILHRDLKLCNFYLDQNNNIKLGDFGFACQLVSDYDRKRQTCGTPNYIAPEAISGFGYSYSSDVWAIGVILFRLKYGCCPFQGQSVKKTLENVKQCLYRFPSKPKISIQLKDLIEKILVINYDERLTTQQILQHKFFCDDPNSNLASSPSKEIKQQKRGFSLSRLFSMDKYKNSNEKQKQKNNKQEKKQAQTRGRQGMMQRQSRNTSNQKKQEPKRSNSCQTFKEIKQIFKNKSKQNLQTSSNCTQTKKQPMSSPYYTLTTVSSATNRQKDYQNSSKTNRGSINQYSNVYSVVFNQSMDNPNSKKQQGSTTRSNKVNQFIKSHVISISLKEQLKINKLNSSKNSISNPSPVNSQLITRNTHKIQNQNGIGGDEKQNPTVSTSRNSNNLGSGIRQANGTNFINGNQKIIKLSTQQLYNYSKKYYLPMEIQQQKDVIIIHYKSTVKQIIYSNVGYIMHRNVKNLYRMTGELVITSQLPKVFKHIIENKIQIKQFENNNQEYDYGQNNINKILQYVPHSWVLFKDGIILKYNMHNFIVAKLFIQEGYYASDESSSPIMYTVDNYLPKLLQGVVIMKIYLGWVKNNLKK